ncbi:MAG: DNA-binding transcriptional MerR regulator, partial [Kiritimatiellia bacterium]
MPETPFLSEVMTIGAVARATGIPANTLRTWERRYGFPEPQRTPGGQRVYATSLIPHLRLVARALSSGSRARQVLSLDREALERLVCRAAPVVRVEGELDIEEWLGLVAALDAAALKAALRLTYARLGSIGFMERCVGPLLSAIGDAWRSGELAIYQEHFASECVQHVLVGAWSALEPLGRRGRVVCATLPREDHGLGAHMAALALATGGYGLTFVGRRTPLADIVACASDTSAVAVALSISVFSDADQASQQLGE